jgi:hypothetical protein
MSFSIGGGRLCVANGKVALQVETIRTIALDRYRPCAEGKKTPDCPQVGRTVEQAIRQQPDAGYGTLKVANIVGSESGTVQGVRREMAGQSAKGA